MHSSINPFSTLGEESVCAPVKFCSEPSFAEVTDAVSDVEEDEQTRIAPAKVIGGSAVVLAVVCLLVIDVPRSVELNVAEIVALSLTGLVVCLVVSYFIVVRPRTMCSDAVTVATVFFCIALAPIDVLAAGGAMERVWSFLILALDVFLLVKSSDRVVNVVLFSGVLWLLLVQGALVMDFGGLGTGVPDICNCKNPPCRIPMEKGAAGWVIECAVVLANFAFVKRLLADAAKAREKMHIAVEATHRVAMFLSCFELDEAENVLDEEVLLPDLQNALRQVLENLRTYKPYLPRSCLPSMDDNTTYVTGSRQSLYSHRFSNVTSDSLDSNPHRLSLGKKNVAHQMAFSALSVPGSPTGRDTRLSVVNFAAMPSKTKYARIGEHRTLTLLTTNMDNTCALLAAMSEDEVEIFFSDFIETALHCFQSGRGLIDIFLGDRLYVSFNASRPCTKHSATAITCAISFASAYPQSHAAIVTGKSRCGDVGSSDMKRFTVLGMLPVCLFGLERVGRKLGIRILCDSICRRDVIVDHDLRLVLQKVRIVKAGHAGGPPEDLFPYQVCPYHFNVWEYPMDDLEAGEKQQDNTECTHAHENEWMYEIHTELDGKWGAFNEAGAEFLNGAAPEVFLEVFGKSSEDMESFQTVVEFATTEVLVQEV